MQSMPTVLHLFLPSRTAQHLRWRSWRRQSFPLTLTSSIPSASPATALKSLTAFPLICFHCCYLQKLLRGSGRGAGGHCPNHTVPVAPQAAPQQQGLSAHLHPESQSYLPRKMTSVSVHSPSAQRTMQSSRGSLAPATHPPT